MQKLLALTFAGLTATLAIACGGDDGTSSSFTGASGTAGAAGGAGGSDAAGGSTTAGTGGVGQAGSGTSGSSTTVKPLPESKDFTGCDGAKLLQTKDGGDDPGVRGPWPVGARTVTIDGLTTEVWYPAEIGSQEGKPYAQYDIREQLPDADATKIPDEKNPLQICDCHRDLPIDAAHGKYPVVLFIHGTAAFRTQSLTQMTHWASRGFVVLAADHPKIRLKDALNNLFGVGSATQAADGKKILASLEDAGGPLGFLDGHADVTRLAVSGHSAGGGAAAQLNGVPGVGVIIPLASQGTKAGMQKSNLIMGGKADGIAAYSGQQSGYNGAPKRKRLVGLADAGHLAFSDLCFIGRDQGGILQIALDSGVNVPQLVGTLAKDGCKPGQLPAEDGWKIINFATTGVLEELLQCNADMTGKLSTLASMPHVAEFKEDL